MWRSSVLLVLILASICSCTTEFAPDEQIRINQFSVKTEHLRYCLGTCQYYDRSTVRYRWTNLDESFYEHELGENLPWTPQLSHLIVFPKRRALVGLLSDSNGDWLLTQFLDEADKPRLRFLAGCWRNESTHVTKEGIQPGEGCSALPSPPLRMRDVYSRSMEFSFHDGYWIDYRTEQLHELRFYPYTTHELEQVIGLTTDRSAVLSVYRAYGKQDVFLLCAADERNREPEAACRPFERSNAPQLLPRERGKEVPPPLPAAQLTLYDLDTLPAALNWKNWLATRYDLERLGTDGRPRPLE